MSSDTTNYDFTLPAVNSAIDQDLWGGELNSNFTSLDGLLFTATNNVTTTKATTYTATEADSNKEIICDATSAAFTVNLPAAASVWSGFTLYLKKIDSTTNAITIDGNASETIDGSTTYALAAQYDAVMLVCDGSNWVVASTKATVVDATTLVKGITRYATNAEAIAQSLATAALTASNLAAVFDTSTSGSGYIKIGGITFQWGNTGTYDENVSVAISFPVTFSTACYNVVGISNTHITASSAATAITAFTTSGFTMFTGGGGGGQLRGIRWVAFGK